MTIEQKYENDFKETFCPETEYFSKLPVSIVNVKNIFVKWVNDSYIFEFDEDYDKLPVYCDSYKATGIVFFKNTISNLFVFRCSDGICR